MRKIKYLSDEEKRESLQQIIRQKCMYPISDFKLQRIIQRLNIHRVYVIKTTRNPKKFLNMVTREYIAHKDRKVMSEIFPLYGTFHLGQYIRVGETCHSEVGVLDEQQDAGAVKMTVMERPDQSVSVTYSLLLYEVPPETRVRLV